MHDSIHSYLSSLAKLGVSLAAAKRSAMFRLTLESQGTKMDILYVAAFKQEAVPESFAVKRRVQFG